MSTTVSPPAAPAAQSRPGLRRGHLSAGMIAFFVIAAVAPLAGISGASPVVFASNGAAAPATFVLAGLLFAVFSVGYVAMSRHISNAGGFVAYIARGLGVRAATAAAFITLLTYIAIMCAITSQYAVFAQQMFENQLGIDLPAQVWLYVTLAAITLVVCRGVDLSIKVAGALLAAEILVILIFDVVVIGGGGASGNTLQGFRPSNVFGPGLGIAFLFSVAAFVGFEATVVFSEEARDSHRTISKAVMISIAVIAILYAVTTYALSISWGAGAVQEAAINNSADFVLAQAHLRVGAWMETAMNVLIVTSFIASLLGFHNMFARLVFSLGRADVLPSWLGQTTSKTGTPARAAAAIGITVAVIIGGFLIAGADLITVIFSWLLALGTVGLVVILVLTSISVIAFFARERVETSMWTTKIAPTIALVGFATVGYLAIANYETLLGGQGGFARWLLLLIPIVAVAGWIAGGRESVTPDYAADLG